MATSAPETSHYRQTFIEVEKLGGGGQGCVFKVEDILVGEFYAVKKVRFSRNRQDEVVEEAKALARLNNPCIVRYYHTWVEECNENDNSDEFESEESENSSLSTGLSDQMYGLNVRDQDRSAGVQVQPDKRIRSILYIKMELCTTTLAAWIRERNEQVSGSGLQENDGGIKDILRQILLALEHIHGRGIIHRDLKPANVFIVRHEDRLMIKIGDFGLCKLTQFQSQTPNPSNSAGVAGTYPYAAPEMPTVKDTSVSLFPCTERVDIYSLGIIYLELLVKIKTTQELVHIVKMVLKGLLPEELEGDEWDTQVGLLKRMLQKGAEDRSSATELLRSLFMSQPCSDEKVAFLERVIAHQDAKIKNYQQKVQNAQEPVLQKKKLNLYTKKKLNEETSRDSTKDLQRALKRKRKEKKNPFILRGQEGEETTDRGTEETASDEDEREESQSQSQEEK